MLAFKTKTGFNIPAVGLGTMGGAKGEVLEAVKTAISVGYRHLDCARLYANEEEIGEAIAAKIADGTVSRGDLFITTKLWSTFNDPKDVKPACQESLKKLKLDYVDLFLMHLPMALAKTDKLFPTDSNGKIICANVDFVDTWKAMEALVDEGLCKAIGISNFNTKQIARLLESCRIPPVNLQIESSPYLINQRLIDFAQSRDITVTAYSPLGSPNRPWAKPEDPQLFEEPLLKSLSAKYKKTPAQIVLRFQLDRGVSVIPKSVKEQRLKENINLMDFSLTKEEVAQISAFNRNFRSLDLKVMDNHPEFPFNEPL